MRRDLGSEVLVAIGAVAVLAFAVTFGILLSISDTANDEVVTPVATAQGQVIANVGTDVDVGEATEAVISADAVPPTGTPTDTDEAATITPTSAPTSDDVPEKTEPVQIETDAKLQLPDEGRTAQATSDDDEEEAETEEATEPVIVPTETPEPTNTDEPTNTPTATRTPTPTSTPTLTPSDTPTSTPTATSTRTPTATRTPSNTPTFTPTSTPTATATRTPRPTETNSIIATNTPTDTPVATATPACGAPASWPTYVVQSGDTLFSLARAVGSTVDDLLFANCLDDADRIVAGTELFVPRLPTGPVRTAQPGLPGGDDLTTQGCNGPFVQIGAPSPGDSLNRGFRVTGTANLPNMEYFKLEIRSDTATTYNFWSRSDDAVINGTLGIIDRGLFGDGVHYLRLVAVDITGNVPADATCVVPVVFE